VDCRVERIPFTRLTISIVLLFWRSWVILAVRQKEGIGQEWRSKSSYFWMIEGLALAFFTFDLLIRLGNPDLWHPIKGEKADGLLLPAGGHQEYEFSAYDPWFGGGYMQLLLLRFLCLWGSGQVAGKLFPKLRITLSCRPCFAMVALAGFFLWLEHRSPPAA